MYEIHFTNMSPFTFFSHKKYKKRATIPSSTNEDRDEPALLNKKKRPANRNNLERQYRITQYPHNINYNPHSADLNTSSLFIHFILNLNNQKKRPEPFGSGLCNFYIYVPTLAGA